jgi:hypothetical protein
MTFASFDIFSPHDLSLLSILAFKKHIGKKGSDTFLGCGFGKSEKIIDRL